MLIVTTTEIQNSFGRYLQLSRYEEIVITKNGKKISKLVPYVNDDPGRWTAGESSPQYSHKGNKVSYEEFLKLAEESENRYEYIDGEIFFLASPLYPHQKAISKIFTALSLWFGDKECEPLVSPFDVTLYRLGKEDQVNVVQPDILVICDPENIDRKGKYKGTPALVVEVLSDSTRSKDLIQKLDLYMVSGVGEYWAVNTDSKEVVIYRFNENEITKMLTFKGSESATSILFTELEVSLKEIFT